MTRNADSWRQLAVEIGPDVKLGCCIAEPEAEDMHSYHAIVGCEVQHCQPTISIPSSVRRADRYRDSNHFDDDLSRTRAIHALAIATESTDRPVAFDLARAGLAFGVGALDAYLCDAFTDTPARCLKSCRRNHHAPPNGVRSRCQRPETDTLGR